MWILLGMVVFSIYVGYHCFKQVREEIRYQADALAAVLRAYELEARWSVGPSGEYEFQISPPRWADEPFWRLTQRHRARQDGMPPELTRILSGCSVGEVVTILRTTAELLTREGRSGMIVRVTDAGARGSIYPRHGNGVRIGAIIRSDGVSTG